MDVHTVKPRESSHLHRNCLYSSHYVHRTHRKIRSEAKKAIEEGSVVRLVTYMQLLKLNL